MACGIMARKQIREQIREYFMPNAFITGATGFVGQHLAQQLTEDGWQVTVFRREGSDPGILDTLDVRHAYGDITDAESIDQAMPDQCDAVYHVAASTNMWRRNNAVQTRINVDGTANMIEAARNRGVGRFIHTSSIATYGFVHGMITESTERDTDCHWINYIRTKAIAEQLVFDAAADLDVVILNPAHIMGPLDQHNWVRLFRMVAENKLPGIPPGSGSFVDVREVARGHIRAYSDGVRGENYLLGGVNGSFVEVVNEVARQLGVEVRARKVPAAALKLMARLKTAVAFFSGNEPDITPESAAIVSGHERVDSSKARNVLGLSETPLDSLIADTLDWMRECGMLTG